jgi:hypothetical protein
MHLPGGMIVRQTLRPVFRPTKFVPGRAPFYSAVFLVAPWRAAIKKSGVGIVVPINFGIFLPVGISLLTEILRS